MFLTNVVENENNCSLTLKKTEEITLADYEALDIADMQSEFKRVTTEAGSYDGEAYLAKYVRLPERDGYTQLRILPRKKGQKLFCVTRVHTLVNPTTGQKKTYHCPKNLVQTKRGEKWEGECIICKYYSDLWQQSESKTGKAQEDLQNQAREIKPVERYYYNVIVRQEKDKDGNSLKNVGPKVYSCGKTVHSKIVRAIVGDEDAGESPLGDVSHPSTGRDFRVVKKTTKGGGGREYPNYDNSKFEDVSSAGSPDELETWIENLNDLQALRALKTQDELKHALRVHLGMVKEGVSQDDSELDEFRTGSSAPKSTASAPSEAVREELVVASAPSSNDSGDEVMADDDFMSELDAM